MLIYNPGHTPAPPGRPARGPVWAGVVVALARPRPRPLRPSPLTVRPGQGGTVIQRRRTSLTPFCGQLTVNQGHQSPCFEDL